jgi:hypothetical protein
LTVTFPSSSVQSIPHFQVSSESFKKGINLKLSIPFRRVAHAQLRKIINTGTKTRHRKSNLRNKGQYHLSSEKHVIMIIIYTEKVGFFP